DCIPFGNRMNEGLPLSAGRGARKPGLRPRPGSRGLTQFPAAPRCEDPAARASVPNLTLTHDEVSDRSAASAAVPTAQVLTAVGEKQPHARGDSQRNFIGNAVVIETPLATQFRVPSRLLWSRVAATQH